MKGAYVFGEDSYTPITGITDGTSNTFAMGEQTLNSQNGNTPSWAYRGWAQVGIDPMGIDNTTSPPYGLNLWEVAFNGYANEVGIRASWYVAASQHPGGVNFVFCDGSVRFVQQTIDAVSLNELCMKSDGFVIPTVP